MEQEVIIGTKYNRHIAISYFFVAQIGVLFILWVLSYLFKWKVSIILPTDKNLQNSRFNNNDEKDWDLINLYNRNKK